jgi:ergothioneine biosynthesis protein EgtB
MSFRVGSLLLSISSRIQSGLKQKLAVGPHSRVQGLFGLSWPYEVNRLNASRAVIALESNLLARLAEARSRTDALFLALPPNAFYERPIPERHRLIFYLGHLEAFDFNLLGEPLGLTSHDETFNKLFAFGIDPMDGGLPKDQAQDWPTIARVEKYTQATREYLDQAIQNSGLLRAGETTSANELLLNVAIEHRLMHAETLAYLLHNLPTDKKNIQPYEDEDDGPGPEPSQVTIPSGIATLGQPRRERSFGWDNEFGEQKVLVPGFAIDVFPVTNGQYLKFVQARGYEVPKYWRQEDWEWRRKQNLQHPHFWAPRNDGNPAAPHTRWIYRSMSGSIPLPESWPVYVSHAEATAYARWAGRKLPTEEQWHRAAYATPEGRERAYPWGDSLGSLANGNFHHQRWDATPVDDHPEGASAFGVQDLLGNGWEWTSTMFGPLPGFEPFSFYPGYSADFFDSKHYVMKGGSARTDLCMLRRPFRNWFQPHYPYVYGSFRCVED